MPAGFFDMIVFSRPLVHGLDAHLPGGILETLESRDPVLDARDKGAHVIGLVSGAREFLVLDLGGQTAKSDDAEHQNRYNQFQSLRHFLPPENC
jgi:hypothetical protein